MPIATSIRERGFRKWYERELLQGHSHLLLLVCCALAVFGTLEAFTDGRGGERLLLVACLMAAAGIGAWALRRYLFLLMRAEMIAKQAVCPQCKVYARWRVERDDPDADGNAGIVVMCRACNHPWRIGW